jgi:hypothetical protein
MRFNCKIWLLQKCWGRELINTNDKYKSLFPHVSAIQLVSRGKSTIVRERVEYIFTNAGHSNLQSYSHGACKKECRI